MQKYREQTGASSSPAADWRRLARPGVFNLLLLFSVVAAMVFKPTL